MPKHLKSPCRLRLTLRRRVRPTRRCRVEWHSRTTCCCARAQPFPLSIFSLWTLELRVLFNSRGVRENPDRTANGAVNWNAAGHLSERERERAPSFINQISKAKFFFLSIFLSFFLSCARRVSVDLVLKGRRKKYREEIKKNINIQQRFIVGCRVVMAFAYRPIPACYISAIVYSSCTEDLCTTCGLAFYSTFCLLFDVLTSGCGWMGLFFFTLFDPDEGVSCVRPVRESCREWVRRDVAGAGQFPTNTHTHTQIVGEKKKTEQAIDSE